MSVSHFVHRWLLCYHYPWCNIPPYRDPRPGPDPSLLGLSLHRGTNIWQADGFHPTGMLFCIFVVRGRDKANTQEMPEGPYWLVTGHDKANRWGHQKREPHWHDKFPKFTCYELLWLSRQSYHYLQEQICLLPCEPILIRLAENEFFFSILVLSRGIFHFFVSSYVSIFSFHVYPLLWCDVVTYSFLSLEENMFTSSSWRKTPNRHFTPFS